MGSGADVAIEAADISLLRPAPDTGPRRDALARKTWAVLVQGLFWAMIYNVLGIPAAALGCSAPLWLAAPWRPPRFAYLATRCACAIGNAHDVC